MIELPEYLKKEYPFQQNSLNLHSAARMNYVDEGEGRPVVMLHGNPTWSFFYRNVIKMLAPHSRCIVPDHIGCGLSEKPATYIYHLKQHINNVVELVHHLELEEFDLIVHDWGGAIGMGYIPCPGESAADVLASSYQIEVAGTLVDTEASLKPMYDPKAERAKA